MNYILSDDQEFTAQKRLRLGFLPNSMYNILLQKLGRTLGAKRKGTDLEMGEE